MKKFFSLGLAFVMLFMVACGSPSSDENKQQDADAPKVEDKADNKGGEETASGSGPKEGSDQTFRPYLDAEPKTLDISRGSDLYSLEILGKMFDALVSIEVAEDKTEKIVPSGAESWTISDDGLVYEFKIREHNWSDGKPVTAEDYKYGILRTLDPETAAPYSYLLYSIKGSLDYNAGEASVDTVGITTPDQMTLRIELEKPLPYFLQFCYFRTMFPQRKDFVEKYGDQYGTEADTIIGNGAYTLEKWVHNSELVLKKNPDYWDKDSIYLNDVIFKIIKDKNVLYQLLFSNQIDLAAVQEAEWVKKFTDMNLNLLERYMLGTNYTFFNTTDKLFKNEKVRLAFSLATDRENMNKIIFKGKFEPAYGFVAKGIKLGKYDYVDEIPGALKDMQNIDPKELLSEGLKELGMDPDPAKLDITYFTSGAGGSFAKEYTDFLQQMYKESLGVNLKLDIVDWPTFSKRTEKLDYQFAGMAWTGDYNDPTTFLDLFLSTSTVVNTGWKNDEYDALMKKAEISTDDAQRLELYREAEEIVLKSAPIAPTLYRKQNTFYWPHVKNYRVPVLAPFNYKGVYIEK